MNNESANASSSHWQPFIYIGESSSPDREGGDEQESPIISLARAQVGDRVRILSLNCGESDSRLMGMGLIPGAVLEVISCTSSGSVIVSLQDQRLGLGTEMAQRIKVIDVGYSQPSPLGIQATGGIMSEHPPIKLRNATIGSLLRVFGYEPTALAYKRKLLAMGLTPGTVLQVMRHAPLGDPTEIQVRNFRLSLRKDEADALLVMPAGGEDL